MLQLITIYSTYILLAALLGVAVIAAPFVLSRVLKNGTDTVHAVAIFWLCSTSAVLNVAFIPRNLYLLETISSQNNGIYENGIGITIWLSRIFTASIITYSLSVLIRWLLSNAKNKTQYGVRLVVGTLAAYYVLNIIFGAVISGYPSFNYKSLYLPVALISIASLRNIDLVYLCRHLKVMLAALMMLSLIFAFINPDYAMLRPYNGQLPGIDFRLYGVTTHANTLGFMALFLILLEIYYPSGRVFKFFILLIAGSNFILAQSKTAWLTALLIIAFVYVPHQLIRLKECGTRESFSSSLRMVIGIVLVLTTSVLYIAFQVHGSSEILSEATLSFTGRTSIWADTLREFVRNPVFGYGPELWSDEYRARLGKLYVGQAHNQIIQTLGESGLVGLILLLLYLGALLKFSLQSFVASRGLTLAIYLTMLARCMTEAPLRGILNDWPFFAHAVMLVVILYYVEKIDVNDEKLKILNLENKEIFNR